MLGNTFLRGPFDPMQSNPFAPPGSVVTDPSPAATMRKPLSVWLTQALAIIAAGIFLVGLASARVMEHELGLRAGTSPTQYAEFVVLLAGVGLTVFGSQRRRGYGRWVGMLLMAAVFVCAGLFCGVVLFLARTNPDGGGFDLRAEDRAALLVAIPLVVVTPLLCWAYGFSNRCRAWFGAHAAS